MSSLLSPAAFSSALPQADREEAYSVARTAQTGDLIFLELRANPSVFFICAIYRKWQLHSDVLLVTGRGTFFAMEFLVTASPRFQAYYFARKDELPRAVKKRIRAKARESSSKADGGAFDPELYELFRAAFLEPVFPHALPATQRDTCEDTYAAPVALAFMYE